MKYECSRCGNVSGEGELIDDAQFLCNACLHVLIVDAQIDAERDQQHPCEHDWHLFGTTRHRDGTLTRDCGCQTCGATRTEPA